MPVRISPVPSLHPTCLSPDRRETGEEEIAGSPDRGLALALVATLGGTEVLSDRQPDSADRAASAAEDDGFLSRVGKAADNLVGGSGSGRAKPEVISAGLAVQEKPPEAKKWPPQKRVKELTGKRTANGKVFQLSDGRTQAEISMVPLHYRDAKGTFQTIDTRVRPVKEKGTSRATGRTASPACSVTARMSWSASSRVGGASSWVWRARRRA